MRVLLRERLMLILVDWVKDRMVEATSRVDIMRHEYIWYIFFKWLFDYPFGYSK